MALKARNMWFSCKVPPSIKPQEIQATPFGALARSSLQMKPLQRSVLGVLNIKCAFVDTHVNNYKLQRNIHDVTLPPYTQQHYTCINQ